MKILYLHQYYKTPEEGGAIRSFHIAKAMSENGHHVDVITSSNDKKAKFVDGKIVVHYFKIGYSNSYGFIRRIFAFLLFIIFCTYKSFKVRNVNLIYATSTPLTVAIPCLIVSFFRKIPFVFEVRDLWPGVPQELGLLKNTLVLNILYKLEFLVYLKANTIIVLSEGMYDNIVFRYPQFKHKIHVVTNFCDLELASNFPKIISKSDNVKVKICYTGTLGFANEVNQLIDLAIYADLHFKNKFEFSIIGDGAQLQMLKSIAPVNVSFFNYLNKNDTYKILSESDFSYVSYKVDSKLLHTGSPNKFFDSLSLGTIPIINFQGWIFNLLHNEDVLLFHEKYNEKDLLLKLLNICKSNEIYGFYSLKCLKVARTKFSKNDSLDRIIFILNNIK